MMGSVLWRIIYNHVRYKLLLIFSKKKKLIHGIDCCRYVKDLDNFISPVMFLDFIVCSLMLCAIGLQATLVIANH